MKKLLKERVFQIALVSLLITAGFSIWFYLSSGTSGLMAWEPMYQRMFICFFLVCLIPVVALIPWLIWKNKPTAIISVVFSGLAAFAWTMVFLVITMLCSVGTPSQKLNLLRAEDPLPVDEIASDDVTTPVFRLGFGSDPHWGGSKQNLDACRTVLEGIAAADNDAIFLLGDISDMGILNYYSDAIEDMETYLGDVPLRLLPGNHDALICALPHFRKMFHQQGENGCYRMDGGSVHILVITMLWDDHEFSRNDEKWLISQLEDIPEEDTVIVLSHCFYYGSGMVARQTPIIWGDIKRVVERVCPILEKYKVDLVVSGHNHCFEYLESGDTSYCVIGTMGGQLDGETAYESPYSKWHDKEHYGWLEATIYTDRIELEYLDMNGELLYQKTVRTRQ